MIFFLAIHYPLLALSWKHERQNYTMKKIILLTAIFLGTIAITKSANAQVQVAVNVNIGSQPAWGPVGYEYVDYYYMPDIDVYYYVPRRQFIYFSNGRWIFATSLPGAFRHYDFYSGYKVVINEPKPYLRGNVFRERYARYKGKRNEQVPLRHDNGNHNGWDQHEGKHGHGNKH